MTENEPENQIVGELPEVTLGDITVDIGGGPVEILKTPAADARADRLVRRLRVAQNRLLRRTTGSLSRLSSLLGRVNGLRAQLKVDLVTLKDIRGLRGPNNQK